MEIYESVSAQNDHQLCTSSVMDWYQFPRSHIAKLNEHQSVQKKTFVRWINSQLNQIDLSIDDLSELRDGVALIALLVILSGQKMRPEKGTMRLHRLANACKVLSFLEEEKVKLINIRAEDIVDGNEKLLLSLIWQIIMHYCIQNKELLLQWARTASTTENSSVDIKDFTHSWRDGKAFMAILRRYRPELQYEVHLDDTNAADRLEKAFTLLEELGVDKLLNADDFRSECLDEKSIMTYVASMYSAFHNKHQN